MNATAPSKGVEKMNKSDLLQAMNLKADVAVSIYAPTHRRSPENQGDKIVVKNLITQALEKIEALGPKRDYENLIAHLHASFESIDWANTMDGLALLVSAEGYWKYDLNHQPILQASVSNSFSISELARTANKSFEYHLLVLSESPTKLFRGDRETLTEIHEDFPIEHLGRGGEQGLPTDFGQRTSVVEDEEHRKFFRSVAEALSKTQAKETLPLIATGVERFLAFWKDVAPNQKPAVAIEGSYDFMSEGQLSQKVWPSIQQHFRNQNELVVKNLDLAKSEGTYVGGIQEVLELAEAGRVAQLVIAEEQTNEPRVELAVRATLTNGGLVSFVPAEHLASFATVAAELRF